MVMMMMKPDVAAQVGIPLEMSNSWWRVGLVYSLGVVAGALCSSLTSPGTFLAGASGNTSSTCHRK